MWPHFFQPPKNSFLSPPLWPRREHIWTLKCKESLPICCENCLGVPYSIRQSRNRMINNFIIANINSIVIEGVRALFLFSKCITEKQKTTKSDKKQQKATKSKKMEKTKSNYRQQKATKRFCHLNKNCLLKAYYVR